MIDSLDSPNLTLLLLDTAGQPLCAEQALDRTAALRYELRENAVALSVAPTARATIHCADAAHPSQGPLIVLGAVALAVLPPMLPALTAMLRTWLQRNPGLCMTLQVMGDDTGATHDPTRLDAAAEAALIACLQCHLDECWGDAASPAA
ncbi:hypothetical protein [uncultured Thiohalocapsa sp.]|uniref:hypothetical protein n=1 Tax=uncultured Thiohalocapsa sp. TaxID=768990 RepID=UPI002600DDD4|nr:hypothetical protein [uncultured Thiohalocapsa sp.]